MPAPTRVNAIKLDPTTGSPYPTLVFETALANETLEKLLADADMKHFGSNTSICCWVGLKVHLRDSGNHVFWLGWGRRRPSALGGLNLEQETTDANGYRTMLPVHTATPLIGELVIPSQIIFGPAVLPPNTPPNYVLPFEDVRQMIDRATAYANL